MRKSHAFRPAGIDRLEGREVLSAVVFTGLSYKHLIRDIDLAFKHYAADYGYAIHRVPGGSMRRRAPARSRSSSAS